MNRASNGGAAIELRSVSVVFDQRAGEPTVAVSDASFDVPAGTTVALLGPSGCGKTSLLRAIAGLERPQTGQISIGGTVVSRAGLAGVPDTWVRPERRNVGMVFQDGALFPHLTVAQNVEFGLRFLDVDDRSERVQRVLSLVDLAGFADRLPATLSGGQQQRVALARSLAPAPSVLLLDEPFSALDAGLRTQVRTEVADVLRRVGVTAVFVTHDQDEAFVIGDEVVVMRDGHIAQVGTPDQLYRHPSSPWIAGFVGEANILSGRIERDAGTVRTLLGDLPADGSGVAGSGVGDGDPVDVLIRPEELVITAALGNDAGIDAGNGADVGAEGTVTAVEYYGHDVRYVVDIEAGPRLAVRAQSPSPFRRGDSVVIRFTGARVPIWPVDGTAVVDPHAATPVVAT